MTGYPAIFESSVSRLVRILINRHGLGRDGTFVSQIGGLVAQSFAFETITDGPVDLVAIPVNPVTIPVTVATPVASPVAPVNPVR